MKFLLYSRFLEFWVDLLQTLPQSMSVQAFSDLGLNWIEFWLNGKPYNLNLIVQIFNLTNWIDSIEKRLKQNSFALDF